MNAARPSNQIDADHSRQDQIGRIIKQRGPVLPAASNCETAQWSQAFMLANGVGARLSFAVVGRAWANFCLLSKTSAGEVDVEFVAS